MKNFLTIIGILCFGVGSIFAQTVQVSGTITSADDGQPLPGVSVVVKGTTSGTVTNIDGKYSFNVATNAVLQFTFVGMATQEIEVGNRQVIDVVMSENAQALEEVVVVAYGTQTAKSLTSSISTVKSDAFKDAPSVSVDQILQGRAAGVSITTPSAAVGQNPVINIRGVSTINSGTQPLFVVDGMPIESGDISLSGMGNANALADINPADILSMDILKDAAAAALYGSRAANGVILITTRKGQQGSARVSYDMNYGFTQKTKVFDVLNAQQYTDFKNMAYANHFGQGEIGFGTMTDANGKLVDTNWADLLFKNGVSQNHTLSVTGGSDKTQYYMSANLSEYEGIVVGDKYNRIGLKANATSKATDWLKVGLNFGYTKSQTSYIDGARNGTTFATGGFPRSAIILPSNLPAYNDDGTPFHDDQNRLGFGGNSVACPYFNPMAMVAYKNSEDTYVHRVIASGFAEATPVKGLVLKTQYGIDYYSTEIKRFWNPKHGDGFAQNGLASAYHINSAIWTWTNTANYSLTLGNNHHIDLLAGMEASETDVNLWGAEGMGLADDAFHDYEASYDSYTGQGDIYNKSLISYFGRINYDYAFKYLFSANFRRDGYSPLGINNRWGNFGGVSAAWRISGEGFFENLKNIFNDVKLKASWGIVGNADIGFYPARSYYRAGYYGANGTYFMSNIGDQNLKWETTQTYDIGLSLRMFDRVTLDLDYYYSKSSDLILKVPQAPSTGIPGPEPVEENNELTTNAGKMQNKGFEFTLGVDVIKNREFTWNTNFNITFNQNKVLELIDDILSSDDGSVEINNKTVEGKSVGQLYVYPSGGIDRETGRRVFYGPNGEKTFFSYPNGWYLEDGTIYQGELEPVLAGNTLPTWYGGWHNSFAYKGFDLNIFFQFSGGNYIYNGTKATTSDMRFWNNTTDVLENYWREDRKDATYALPVYGDNYSNGSAMSISDWVEKGDYVRLKNVSLGYTFNTKNWPKKIGISSLRIYAQAQNLFVITGYTGLDPEVISNVVSPILTGGVDKNTLPQARTYTVGLNVSF